MNTPRHNPVTPLPTSVVQRARSSMVITHAHGRPTEAPRNSGCGRNHATNPMTTRINGRTNACQPVHVFVTPDIRDLLSEILFPSRTGAREATEETFTGNRSSASNFANKPAIASFTAVYGTPSVRIRSSVDSC